MPREHARSAGEGEQDGEYRRAWWHFDFFQGLVGVTPYTTDTGNWGLAAALGLMRLVTTLALYAVAHRLSGGRALSMG